jgi:thiosulfate dehydrogenase
MNKIFFVIIALLIVASSIWMYNNMHLSEQFVSVIGGRIGQRYYGMSDKEGALAVKFDLVDPECAPEMALTKILYGYHLMLNTRAHAAEYVGNQIDCNNCHFNAGNTLGGKNRGISLAGVTAVYPRYSKRDKKEISLRERINNCFKRSMNGKPLPENSLEMESLIAYLAWISHELNDAPKLPWLGLDDVPSKHQPNTQNGEKVYARHCSICHKSDGEGSASVPPLWGNNSFNDGAGMNTLPKLSSFVWQNMPYGQPVLTPEEALDVAAYIISRPRPQFKG